MSAINSAYQLVARLAATIIIPLSTWRYRHQSVRDTAHPQGKPLIRRAPVYFLPSLDKSGQSNVEYSMILVVIAVVVLFALTLVGAKMTNIFSRVTALFEPSGSGSFGDMPKAIAGNDGMLTLGGFVVLVSVVGLIFLVLHGRR